MSLGRAWGLLAVVVGMANGARAQDTVPVPPPDPYQELMQTYARAPDAEGEADALRLLRSWRTNELAERARGLPSSPPLHRAAIVLHTQAAFSSFSDGETVSGQAHLEIAREVASQRERDTPFRQAWLIATGAEVQARYDAPLALSFFEECRDAFPRAADAWLGIGTVYEWSAFPDGLGGWRVPGASRSLAREAERAYRAALGIDPSLAEARVRLGRVLERLGRPEEARRELERAAGDVRDNTTRALAHLFLGEVQEARGASDAALREYRAALAAEPALQPAAIALSALLVARGERAQAVAALRDPLGGSCAVGTPPWLAYHVGLGTRAVQALADVRREARAWAR